MTHSVNPPKAAAAEPVVVPPKPTAEEEAEQKRRRERELELRQRMSVSKLRAIGPAGYTPYWARKNDESELARLEYLGFVVVRETDPANRRWKAQKLMADGTYQMGDVILLEIRTEDYEFYLRANSEKAEGMSQSMKEAFIQEAEKRGSPTFTLKRK